MLCPPKQTPTWSFPLLPKPGLGNSPIINNHSSVINHIGFGSWKFFINTTNILSQVMTHFDALLEWTNYPYCRIKTCNVAKMHYQNSPVKPQRSKTNTTQLSDVDVHRQLMLSRKCWRILLQLDLEHLPLKKHTKHILIIPETQSTSVRDFDDVSASSNRYIHLSSIPVIQRASNK